VDLETSRRDEFGDLYGSFSTMRDSLREEIESAEAQQERAEAAKAESEAFARTLEERAAAFGATMEECADGDLTARLDAQPDDPRRSARSRTGSTTPWTNWRRRSPRWTRSRAR